MGVLSEYLDMKRGTVALRSGSEVSILAAYGMTEEEIKRGRYRIGEASSGRLPSMAHPLSSEYRRGAFFPEQDPFKGDDQEREHRLSMRSDKIQE